MEFLQKYIIDPILYGGGYNPVNTIVWAFAFVVFTLVAFRITKKLIDVKAFQRLFLPWIIIGGILRPLVDVNIIARSPFVVTPGIYIVTLAACFVCIAIGKIFGKEELFAKFAGWISVLFLLAKLPNLNFDVIALALEACFVVTLFVVAITRIIKQDWLSNGYNFWIWVAHLFEASATSVGIQVGLVEQHVLAGNFISALGANGIFVLKLGVLPLVLWLMRDLEDNVKVFTKTFVFALGFGPGLRDLLLAAIVS